ncbi:hypothetical protein E2C01_044469 [Portunus trituberculatus]|uniref:Uncharacterized protein n=1 Tax=Portunus trituberculatus TaxID=210409 RepID=A0A5B7FS96_PORTR|nr:hypothetical protein [Portunus trituberculatus]
MCRTYTCGCGWMCGLVSGWVDSGVIVRMGEYLFEIHCVLTT